MIHCIQIEVPFQALLSLSTSSSTPEEKSQVEAQSKMDINNNLSAFEDHLAARTFFVGEKMSLVDVAIFALYQAMMKLEVVAVTFPSLFRWFMTVGSCPLISAVAGDVSSLASSSISQSGGLWDRYVVRIAQ
jgi:glutathione S-transferase